MVMTSDELIALSKRHTISEWSVQNAVDPIPVAHARGVHFWTPDGRRFIDFNSQLMAVNIGHGDPRVVKAIQDQIAPWLLGRLVTLGTDGFGRSDNREYLRSHFEVNAASIAAAALSRLSRDGKMDAKKVVKAFGELGVNPDKIDAAIA